MFFCFDVQVVEFIEVGFKVGEVFDDDDGFEIVLFESFDDFECFGFVGLFFVVVEGGVVGEENLGVDLNEMVEDSVDVVVRVDVSLNCIEGGSIE